MLMYQDPKALISFFSTAVNFFVAQEEKIKSPQIFLQSGEVLLLLYL